MQTYVQMFTIHNEVLPALAEIEKVADPRHYLFTILIPQFLQTNEDEGQIVVSDKLTLHFARCCTSHPVFVSHSEEQLALVLRDYFGDAPIPLDEDNPGPDPLFMSPIMGEA